MRTLLSLISSVVLSLALNAPAEAVPLLPGESALFNVDLSGASRAPPYTAVSLSGSMGMSGGGTLSCTIFDSLNGTGETVGISDCWGLWNFTQAIAVDGVFSLLYTYSGGRSGDVSLEHAIGHTDFGATWPVTVQVAQVPEPGTLALLSLGLAGLAFTLRRRQ